MSHCWAKCAKIRPPRILSVLQYLKLLLVVYTIFTIFRNGIWSLKIDKIGRTDIVKHTSHNMYHNITTWLTFRGTCPVNVCKIWIEIIDFIILFQRKNCYKIYNVCTEHQNAAQSHVCNCRVSLYYRSLLLFFKIYEKIKHSWIKRSWIITSPAY